MAVKDMDLFGLTVHQDSGLVTFSATQGCLSTENKANGMEVGGGGGACSKGTRCVRSKR